jgi:hypothetical protein
MNDKPLAIDLYCGLGGWTEGLLAEGYRVVGYDIEAHDYGNGKHYPAQLVLQDVLTIHGSQFKDAALIVASPPCQEFSYMAMPWSRAKAIAAEYRSGKRDVKKLTALFDACFRIQREAIEAAGHFIPMVVENVRGAQPWVGRARWAYGSYYLWGDVPALMPITHKLANGQSPGLSKKLQSNYPQGFFEHFKSQGMNWSGRTIKGQDFTRVAGRQSEGIKDRDADGYDRIHPEAFGWKEPRTTSKSSSRKAASATIAKIPLPLARWIAKVYKPAKNVQMALV